MENTEIEIVETEIVEEITEVFEDDLEEVVVNDAMSYSEVDYSEALAVIQQNTDYIPIIANDVRIVLVLALLTFCWSCMRAWRVNSLGGK